MQVNRRGFFKVCAGGMAGTTLAVLGFTPTEAMASVRQYKLLRAKETRNNCTYCSVGCGLLMYSLGDGAKNAKPSIFHIEGDPDHPVSRGSLCPKGAGLVDYIHSEGRLKYPEYRAPGSDKWQRISWDDAIERIARLMKKDRDANFERLNAKGALVNRWLTTGMLCSSAASNETGVLDQKFARSLGMVAIDCQARLCHGPTVAALAPTFGRGAMTNNWVDIKNANVIIVMGGNAAEAHPVGFKWAVEAKTHNDAKLIVVDPRFNRSAAVADLYAPIRAGSDAAFLLGVVNYLITHDKIHHEYVKSYTSASLIVREDFSFDEGLFSGYNSQTHQYDKSSWQYELGADGFAKRDMTLSHPRCVWNLLKKHVARYTPEMVTSLCGTPAKAYEEICQSLASTCVPNKTATFMYALGWTHHTNGAQIIRAAAMIQLLLGNIGMAGGGINALRGHSNIQGYTDLGLLSLNLPGYMPLPSEKQGDLKTYLGQITPDALLADQVNYWKNTPKFFISMMKSFWGDHAQAANNWGYDWLPKWDRSYDVMAQTELMLDGKMNGYIVQGFNPLAAFSNKNKATAALSKLKYMVVIDPLATETSTFWQNHGEFNDVNSAEIQTEVFRLPSSCFAEENGSIANSGRWLQWHWAAAEPPAEALHDAKILGRLMTRLRELYREEGGVCPEPVLNINWNYQDPEDPTQEEIAREANGMALSDVFDDKGALLLKKGQQLADFSQLRDDGSTASFCWIYAGSWTEAGNQMANRDNTDVGLGCTPGWAWCWPQNRRILYNRASADLQGKPWDSKRKLLEWTGQKWKGIDVPDFAVTVPPGKDTMPFIMLPEGVARLFSLDKLTDGPFPEHYEPIETPIGTNPLHPAVVSNPAARLFARDAKTMGKASDFPYVATTYSITELFRHWTKHARLNAIVQPEQFVEIGENLAKSKGIQAGDMVKVSCQRGYIKAKAVVTKRIKTLTVAGKAIETVGIPCHWGFEGATRKGFLANTLTPSVGDANSQTPEYKAFLVNVEKV
ncbi:Formate dehydrogenase, nitrate-inducible, major subunit [Dickeya dianthicola]|uniref:formate dehydrogenase-N subunit alpha n=1 Tax=Dickeya dianthicola TaxID=204039 RepID=UPI000CD4737E|nr:formate dehydrogenase-N subunit alpha [Dickeya dianthicola]AYC18477.1 Formate dehydrogenase, nitrate-inducible, major subunit [Dickeya dianthicola]MBI0438738.1 formate dehydrogenase-N subunit alpha [Dickeya dianthicola]MBI0450216.1 formate dehydrogenase-N subunit alpha [Dickeya dianthicola]MBI0454532.1 formate dehydrogenase-N subunit alpha [Dickeya dianthicola]MBI0459009.1 formate dehydrogenase-N subunit alpha [Dickeya dianthicola]